LKIQLDKRKFKASTDHGPWIWPFGYGFAAKVVDPQLVGGCWGSVSSPYLQTLSLFRFLPINSGISEATENDSVENRS